MVEMTHSHATRPEEGPTTEGVEDDVSSDDVVLKNFIKRKKPKKELIVNILRTKFININY
jgi:hypothetical protein